MRDKGSLYRHFILVFVAYSFILWMKLTGGLRRQWAHSTLETFREALEAFRTGVSYRFVKWLENNADVYAAHIERLGYSGVPSVVVSLWNVPDASTADLMVELY